jgi:hypothetical protein
MKLEDYCTKSTCSAKETLWNRPPEANLDEIGRLLRSVNLHALGNLVGIPALVPIKLLDARPPM